MNVGRVKNTIRQLTAAECGYVAGILDGEGTIRIGRQSKKTGKPPAFVTGVGVTNTDIRMIEWLIETTGCGQFFQVQNLPTRRPAFRWYVPVSFQESLLNQVKPYLVCKSRQAECVLALIAMRKDGPITEDRRADAAVYYEEVLALNTGGQRDAWKAALPIASPTEWVHCSKDGCNRRVYKDGPLCYQHWVKDHPFTPGTCEECGGEMDMVRPHRRFCSSKCQQRAYHRNRILPLTAAGLDARPCEACGKPFSPKRYRHSQQYCSVGCYQLLRYHRRRAQALGQPEPASLADVVYTKDLGYERTCPECGMEFTARSSKAMYCTPGCRQRSNTRARAA